MTYRVDTYRDAHREDPNGTYMTDDLHDALGHLFAQVRGLSDESKAIHGQVLSGEELLELYPIYGVGTVVLSHEGSQDDPDADAEKLEE